MSEAMIDLREPLRSGISNDRLKELIQQAVIANPKSITWKRART